MPTTIAVTGHAEERIAPELGAVTLSVGGSGAARDDVYGRTSAAHERLLAAVRELEASGALEKWSADQLRVWSYRPWNNEGRQLPVVHQASADVEVVFRDLGRARRVGRRHGRFRRAHDRRHRLAVDGGHAARGCRRPPSARRWPTPWPRRRSTRRRSDSGRPCRWSSPTTAC